MIKVLVVDDEPTWGLLFRESLQDSSGQVEVRVAMTLRDFKALLQSGWLPDVAILDFNMPLTDGNSNAGHLARHGVTRERILGLTDNPKLFDSELVGLTLDKTIEGIEALILEWVGKFDISERDEVSRR